MTKIFAYSLILLFVGQGLGCDKAKDFSSAKRVGPSQAPADETAKEIKQGDSGTPNTQEVVIKGTLSLAEGMQPQQNAVIFIAVRGKPGTPPIFVKKLPISTFPMEFVISEQDAMIPGMPIPDLLNISVRLDGDGDAISRQEGDIAGSLEGVKSGSSDIKIVLNEMIEEARPGRSVNR